ncbi:hypothetical protein APHAL10511_008568 [Amanita phalloides]|nr:hypothetical protein APHAL10511_008568 [Amanita phalloides]
MPENDQAQSAKQLAAIAESMESKNRSICKEMRKSRRPLATWGIKSDDDCNRNSKHQKARKKVEKTPFGPDALAPPWRLPVPGNRDEETDIQPLTSHVTLKQPVTERVTRSTGRSPRSSMHPPLPPSASRSSEGGPSTKDKGKERQRDEENEANHNRPDRGPSIKDKGEKRKRDEEEDEDEAYLDRRGLTAQSLVQQAWSQAVREDGAIIVLSSGNHVSAIELLRRFTFRTSSNRLKTVDRQLQPKSKPAGDGDKDQDRNRGSGSGRGYRGRPRGGRGKRKSSTLQDSAGRKGPTDDEPKAIQAANNRDVVHLYLRYGIYDSPVPATFLRSTSIMAHTRGPTPPFTLRGIRTCGPEECMTIVITSEIGHGATGVVHRSTLELDLEVYRRLRSKEVCRGIATTLGYFDDSEDACHALCRCSTLKSRKAICQFLTGSFLSPGFIRV